MEEANEFVAVSAHGQNRARSPIVLSRRKLHERVGLVRIRERGQARSARLDHIGKIVLCADEATVITDRAIDKQNLAEGIIGRARDAPAEHGREGATILLEQGSSLIAQQIEKPNNGGVEDNRFGRIRIRQGRPAECKAAAMRTSDYIMRVPLSRI